MEEASKKQEGEKEEEKQPWLPMTPQDWFQDSRGPVTLPSLPVQGIQPLLLKLV